jgi:hypothetical protein
MTREEFVISVIKAVYEPAIRGTLAVIEKPPGKKPSEELVGLSEWVGGLSLDNKKKFEAAIALTARQAVIGLLSVIDGVRQIENTSNKGVLELRFRKGDEDVLLNSPEEEFLHDLFNQQVSLN